MRLKRREHSDKQKQNNKNKTNTQKEGEEMKTREGRDYDSEKIRYKDGN